MIFFDHQVVQDSIKMTVLGPILIVKQIIIILIEDNLIMKILDLTQISLIMKILGLILIDHIMRVLDLIQVKILVIVIVIIIKIGLILAFLVRQLVFES